MVCRRAGPDHGLVAQAITFRCEHMLKSGIAFALSLSVMLAVPAARGIAQEAALAGTAGTGVAMAIKAAIGNSPVVTGPDAAPTDGAAAHDRSAVVLSLGDETITIERADTLLTADGLVWTGTVRESGENALLMWGNDGSLTGEFCYRGDSYALATVGGVVHATPETDRQRTADPAPTTVREAAEARTCDGRSGVGRMQQRLALATPTVTPFAYVELRALQANKVTIELMMLYTPKAAGHYKNSMAELIALAVKQINGSFRNSGLENISLRLVHTQMIDYDETDGEHFDHLYRMVDGIGAFNEVRG